MMRNRVVNVSSGKSKSDDDTAKKQIEREGGKSADDGRAQHIESGGSQTVERG